MSDIRHGGRLANFTQDEERNTMSLLLENLLELVRASAPRDSLFSTLPGVAHLLFRHRAGAYELLEQEVRPLQAFALNDRIQGVHPFAGFQWIQVLVVLSHRCLSRDT